MYPDKIKSMHDENGSLTLGLLTLVAGVGDRLRNSNTKQLEQIAEATGLSISTLFAIRASRRVPDTPTLDVLLRHFGIAVDISTHETVLPAVARPA